MPRNPYDYIGGVKKPVPPPAPPKRAGVLDKDKDNISSRKERLGLVTRTYECFQCGARRVHSSGYLFFVNLRAEQLHFCNIDCCDAWEKSNPELKKSTPVPDRRGAIAATRAKNEENNSGT